MYATPITRRSLLTRGAAMSSLAAFGLMGASAFAEEAAQQTPSTEPAVTGVAFDAVGEDVSEAAEANWKDLVSQTAEADIVVIGTGMSGSAAMVSAAEQGASVIALEANPDNMSCNGAYTDCVFEIGTDAQKEAAERYGLTIDPGVIISAEENFFNYRVNGLLWRDIMDHSAGNYEWMAANGVKFAPQVEYYADAGKYPTAHYWEGKVGSSGACYIAPMHEKAAELGVDVRFSTRARALGTDAQGKICCVYAQSVEDGTVTRIDCKAVILAGGGYGCNQQMMAARGLDAKNCVFWSMPGNNGDTLKMAVAVGAKDESLFHGYMDMQVVPSTHGISLASNMAVWVNEDGDRFINEDCTTKTYDVVCPAMRTQQAVYMLVTEKLAAHMFESVESEWISNFAEDLATAADDPAFEVYKSDSIAELAEAAGIDAATLEATVERYNTQCAAGHDADYGKAPEFLFAIEEGPFYLAKMYQQVYITVGGIATNRKFEVTDANKQAIAGLYAVGVDGIETYLELYNTAVSGGCNANNINGGRYAAINAYQTYVAE